MNNCILNQPVFLFIQINIHHFYTLKTAIKMSMNYFDEITRDRGNWKIKSKVHHIWDFKDDGVASAIHLILIDEKVKH